MIDHIMLFDALQHRARDRLRRKLMDRSTPEERIEKLEMIQSLSFYYLKTTPGAWERFWRRNLRQRAVRADAAQGGPDERQ